MWLSRRAAPPPGGAAERHLQGGHGKIGMVTDNQPVMYMYTATTVSISKIGMATDNQPVSKTNLPQSCTYMYAATTKQLSITHQSNGGGGGGGGLGNSYATQHALQTTPTS